MSYLHYNCDGTLKSIKYIAYVFDNRYVSFLLRISVMSPEMQNRCLTLGIRWWLFNNSQQFKTNAFGGGQCIVLELILSDHSFLFR